MVVRGEPVVHKRDCHERKEGEWALEDIYEEREVPSPMMHVSKIDESR